MDDKNKVVNNTEGAGNEKKKEKKKLRLKAAEEVKIEDLIAPTNVQQSDGWNEDTTIAPEIVDPYDQYGNRQGKWLQEKYQFGEWYYDLAGNPVFISPVNDDDPIGDLYDQNSNLYLDFQYDPHGNILPVILMTVNNEYFEFIPQAEYNFPEVTQANTQTQGVEETQKAQDTSTKNNISKKETAKKKEPPKKEPVPPKIPKRLLKQQEQEKTSTQTPDADYKHEKHITLEESKEYEDKNFKEGQDMVRVDRTRDSVNIVFIGHVDAGKSTLCGRILKNTGEVDETEIRKFEQEAKEKNRESWVLAYIMDINEEERTKGITVECGKAHFQLNNRRFILLDAPGHKNYVPNMIAGACQADVAALVISARQGEFEAGFDGGQTQEHAHLAKALGVHHIICVVSKMDEVKWDKKRYEYIKDQVEPFLRNQVGIHSIDWVPINGYENENIDTNVSKERCDWYSGDTLFDKFNKVPIPVRDPNGPVRIPVLDKIKDQGTFLFGKLESGTIRDDIWLTLMPEKKQFQVQSIYNTKDQRVLYASAGENVKIKVKGIEDKDIEKGFMVCNTEDLCLVTQLFIAELSILVLPEHKPILSQGYTCVLHMHTSVSDIEIEEVEALQNPENKKLVKTTFLKNGQTGIVKISIPKSQLCLEKFEKLDHLGRFTLRDEEKTIGYGKVLKIRPIKK